MPIKVLAWNANSIYSKKTEISQFLDSNPHDIILISESRLKENSSFNLPSYSCYRADREHGGVAIFIKSHISHSGLLKHSHVAAEAISIIIHDRAGDFRIASIYCSPNMKRADTSEFFRDVLSTNGPIVIAGDFNAKHSAWNNVNYCRKGSDLYKLCNEKNYSIHAPDDYTLIPHNGGKPSIVDFAISKMLNGASKPIAISDLSSDHFPISFVIRGDIIEPSRKIFNYKKADWQKFRELTTEKIIQINTESQSFGSPKELDEIVDSFTTSISESAEQAIPKKNPYIFRYPHSANISNLTKHRNFYRNKYARSCDPHDKSLVNQLNRMIKFETSKLNNESFSERIANLKAFDNSLYGFTKSLKNKRNSVPPLKKPDGSLAYSDKEKAEVLAHGFHICHLTTANAISANEQEVLASIDWLAQADRAASSAAKCTPVQNAHGNMRRRNPVSCAGSQQVSEREVIQILKSLKLKKAPGPDRIANRVLRNLPREAISALTRIFNACLENSYFPDSWKVAKIITIHKSGKPPEEPSSYRPISLLSCVGKIFEKLMLERLSEHERQNKIFIPQQFGFRTEHSTVQQILRITECASLGFNKNRTTGLALLDLERAFDSVWHDGLVHKLIKNNYPVYLVKLVQSFLKNRSGYAMMNDSSSASFNIPAGVPQGSLLSPHLFNVFINDIDLPSDTNLAIYADDTALFCDVPWKNIKSVSKKLTTALEVVAKFFNSWKIRLNDTKTEVIAFTHSRVMKKRLKENPLKFRNASFEWKDSVKYLGVRLDQRLSFRPHIDEVVKKAYNLGGTFRCLIGRYSKLALREKVTIYRQIIRPVMTYACPIFINCPKTHFTRLQKHQNKVLRMIMNAERFTKTDDLHGQTNIPKICDFVDKLTNTFYETATSHPNKLVRNLGIYSRDNIGFRLKHRLPKKI